LCVNGQCQISQTYFAISFVDDVKTFFLRRLFKYEGHVIRSKLLEETKLEIKVRSIQQIWCDIICQAIRSTGNIVSV